MVLSLQQRAQLNRWGRKSHSWAPGKHFWQDESFDHWVRTPAEFNRIRSYIEGNPVSAGLASRPEGWPWSSAAGNASLPSEVCLLGSCGTATLGCVLFSAPKLMARREG